MLDDIAITCRRWTEALACELVLLVPVYDTGAGVPIGVTLGTRHAASARPDEVLRIAIALGARGFVLVHNHLGPGPPSQADLGVTRRMVAAAATVGVVLHAHLVLTSDGWFDCGQPELRHAWSIDEAA